MQRSNSVLRVNECEERADYASAVSEIIRNILNDHQTTLVDIADRTDISLGTISNAFNKKGVLNPLYLKRLGEAFGTHQLDPYARLFGGRVIPIENADDGDVLPFLTLVGHKIAVARSPSSPGGTREILSEKLSYMPELRALRRQVDALIRSIEAERDAA